MSSRTSSRNLGEIGPVEAEISMKEVRRHYRLAVHENGACFDNDLENG